jgi:hypothetical protein
MIMLLGALWYVFAQIKKLTGQDLDHFLAETK